jgi:hypothetical protein
MGPQLGGDLAEALSAGAARDELFSLTLSTLRSATGAYVLVFEDIHWADEATLDGIRFLGRRVGRLAALLVLTFRDDEVPLDHPLAHLPDLDRSEGGAGISVDLLESLAGSSRLNKFVGGAVRTRAGRSAPETASRRGGKVEGRSANSASSATE